MKPSLNLLLGLALSVAACATEPASTSSDVGTLEERSQSEALPSEDVHGVMSDAERSTEIEDADVWGPADAESELSEVFEETLDELDAGDTTESPDAGPPPTASCQLDVTVGQETETVIDTTFEGFELNKFGAEIYGNMLKIWAGEGETGLELLIRTDQNDLPGLVVPGVPGNEAWIVMVVDGDQAFTTQTASGAVTIETCPSELGTLIAGQIEGVVLFDMGNMSPVTIDGSFEVVLGAITGEAICSGL